jgi:hypothetical protein
VHLSLDVVPWQAVAVAAQQLAQAQMAGAQKAAEREAALESGFKKLLAAATAAQEVRPVPAPN